MNILCAYNRRHKKMGTFEKPNKNGRNPRKKIIVRNCTITTCLLRDSNPNYQCLTESHSAEHATHTHRVTQKNRKFWNA